MKFSILAFFFISALLIHQTKQQLNTSSGSDSSSSDSSSSDSNEQFEDCETLDCISPFIAKLRSLAAQPTATNVTYYWDYLPLKVRYYLLNQNQLKGLRNNLPVNSGYQWTSLSDAVKSKLLEQKNKDLFFGLTLFDWGLVQSQSDRLANLTLNSLIKPSKLSTFETLKTVLAPINFDFKLDPVLVNNYVASLDKYQILKTKNYKQLWEPIEDLLDSYVTKDGLSYSDKYALKLIIYMADLRFKARF